MHDPTEGGLLSGLYELAKAGGVGVRAWKEKVPVLPETRTLSEFLRFDPFSLIASGALLVAAPPRSAERLLGVYRQQGIPAAIIGEIRPARDGMYIIEGNRRRPLRPPARDEIARILESSGNLSRLRFPSR
jgi:hydrogenase maturation factor